MDHKNRYKITIEYLGTEFCGWQKQEKLLSIQQLIEQAIYKFSKEEVVVYAAGRTDAGVHALGQVAHFELIRQYEPRRVMHSINHFCRPYAVGIINCDLVSSDFHARFSATERHYVYKILNRRAVNIINSGLKCWIKEPLDIELMQVGANYLIGKYDFSSFRSIECQASSPIKTLSKISCIRSNDEIDVFFSAPSFLHHMVRNIMGSLLLVGKGIWTPQKIKEILEFQNRAQAGPTAPPEGLYFLKVDY